MSTAPAPGIDFGKIRYSTNMMIALVASESSLICPRRAFSIARSDASQPIAMIAAATIDTE